MTTKLNDNVLHQLLRTMEDLCSKVNILERKIETQNALIIAFTAINKPVSKTTTAINDAQTAPRIATATESRPTRAARLKATAALSTSGGTRNARAAPAKPRSSIGGLISSPNINHPKTDEASRTPPIASTPTLKAKTDVTPEGAVSLIASKEVLNNQIENSHKKITDDEWTQVSHRKYKPRQRRIIVGTGKEDDDLISVDRIKYIQAWQFRPETTSDTVLKFLNKIAPHDEYFVEKRHILTDKHSSFVIGIPESLYELFNSPAVWPPRVRFTDWFRRRPRVERGASRTASIEDTARHTDANITIDRA